jgi:ABC-type multidrug transport system ATPase subunit
MTAALTCKGLWKDYRRNPVLEELGFELANGEALLVTGPNGAGKTTLLSILAGLVSPSAGTLTLDGKDLTPLNHQLRRHIGYSPASENSLFLSVSVRKNLEFWAELQGLGRAATKKIEQLAELWGFTKYLERPVREISSGFRRRVALSRAFLHEPRLVLLDEPMAFLDNENQQRAAASLEQWLSEKRGVLVVSSNVDFERGASWKSLGLKSI